MSTDESAMTQQAPDCERCGTRTYPTTRTMRIHDMSRGRPIPQDQVHPVWRCPSCGREAPRT